MSTTPEPIRISDAERNQAIERLNAFYAEGRLDLDECSARLDEVNAARTDVDLEHALRGLLKPEVHTRKSRLDSLRFPTRRAVQLSTPALICTAIWAMTGHGEFWPEWVWLAAGIGVLSGVRGRNRGGRGGLAGHSHGYGDDEQPGRALPSQDGSRSILTAVFTDIVGSTELAASMGDGPWRTRLRGFEHLAETEMAQRGGSKLFTKGDEVVTTFASPAQAIEYARAGRDGTAKLGLSVRVGIHTGELEGRHDDLSGIALHIGQRVSASAQPNEILVSSTVRELARGSGAEFLDRGEYELRGLPGTWRLYSVGVAN